MMSTHIGTDTMCIPQVVQTPPVTEKVLAEELGACERSAQNRLVHTP